MTKAILTIVWVVCTGICSAQSAVATTNEFTVSGLVEAPLTVTLADVLKREPVNLGTFKITNHLGEFRKEYQNVKGVPLLELLKPLQIKESNPKLLSEYYLVLRASDGYSVVVSWNELFNTEVGKAFFIVTETNNISQAAGAEKILLICTKDFMTGRRHIKGLQTIEVKRI
jgi:hypothetical protein